MMHVTLKDIIVKVSQLLAPPARPGKDAQRSDDVFFASYHSWDHVRGCCYNVCIYPQNCIFMLEGSASTAASWKPNNMQPCSKCDDVSNSTAALAGGLLSEICWWVVEQRCMWAVAYQLSWSRCLSLRSLTTQVSCSMLHLLQGRCTVSVGSADSILWCMPCHSPDMSDNSTILSGDGRLIRMLKLEQDVMPLSLCCWHLPLHVAHLHC